MSRTPEEQRRWLAEQTENCLRGANQPLDSKTEVALEKAVQDYMAELERLTANKKAEASTTK